MKKLLGLMVALASVSLAVMGQEYFEKHRQLESQEQIVAEDRALSVAKLDSRIFAGKAEGGRASFLVVLGESPNLSAATAIADRAARRRFVYETLRAHAEATQAGLRRQLEGAGVPFREHFLVNMIEVEADQALARDLAARRDVSTIKANSASHVALPKTPHEYPLMAPNGIELNIQKVRAPELWDRGFTGQGIVIGSADTGFQWDHPALKNQYRGWNGSAVSHDYNWHDSVHHASAGNPCGSDSPFPCDDYAPYGHGTGTSGIAVGDDGAGNRIGVAPGADLIGCRNMDRGSGTPASYTECFEWFLAPTDRNGENPRPDLGADVINNSWVCGRGEGCEADPEILRVVVENVRAAGIVVVAGAGNDGLACGSIMYPPAIYDASFTIGGTDNDDQISVTSVGPINIDGSGRLKPDMCAPGRDIRTAAPGGLYVSDFTGTSASAPHVAGGIALLWSAAPILAGNVNETELVLEAAAEPLSFPSFEQANPACGGYSGLAIPNPVFGWGRLDVERAYLSFTAPVHPREQLILLRKTEPPTRVVPPRPE